MRDAELRGRRLVAARVIWMALVALGLLSFIVGIPDELGALQRVCPQACVFSTSQAQALGAIGVSMAAYAWLVVALSCLTLLISLVMALLVFVRRAGDWMALVVAYFLAIAPIGNISQISSAGGAAPGAPLPSLPIALIILLLTLPAVATFYGVFLLFPSGRFSPRWSWLLLIAWLIFSVARTLAPNALHGALATLYPVFYGSAILCQLYRFRVVSNPTERQQTKLIMFGFVASLLANQAFWQTNSLAAARVTLHGLYGPLALLIYLVTLLLLPTAFFIAVQRYRLYDIDVVIRRTLIYSALTIILTLIYLGGVVGAQALVDRLARAQDGSGFTPPLVVLTTLVIVALFQPLRARIQRAVDRRFYRSKYDAQRAIAEFGVSLRQQVDLATLSEQLVTVAQETMQPTKTSLWLAQGDPPPASGLRG